jgi:hypothetical protein
MPYTTYDLGKGKCIEDYRKCAEPFYKVIGDYVRNKVERILHRPSNLEKILK